MTVFDGRKPKKSSIGWPWLGIGLTAGLGFILIVMIFMAQAPEASTRLAGLEDKANEMRRLAQTRGDLNAFPAGSVCKGALPASFREHMTRQLTSTGLSLTNLDIAETGVTETRTPLVTNSLSLDAEGAYEGAVSSLALMARIQPIIFIDSLSIKNRFDRVELHIEGRIFCR